MTLILLCIVIALGGLIVGRIIRENKEQEERDRYTDRVYSEKFDRIERGRQ
jgi:hypothetical protein